MQGMKKQDKNAKDWKIYLKRSRQERRNIKYLLNCRKYSTALVKIGGVADVMCENFRKMALKRWLADFGDAEKLFLAATRLVLFSGIDYNYNVS